MIRFEIIPNKEIEAQEVSSSANENSKQIELKDFPIFKSTLLADVDKIEFPFDSEDPEEFYKIKLKDSNELDDRRKQLAAITALLPNEAQKSGNKRRLFI